MRTNDGRVFVAGDDGLGYAATLEELKHCVRAARLSAQRRVNSELVALYWSIGRTILIRQRENRWGSGVVDQLATDLRAAFPAMRGFSRRNLMYMRAFASAWPNAIVQLPVAQLPWGHIIDLLDKLDRQRDREWYAAAACQYGWSRSMLINQLKTRAHLRQAVAPANFDRTLAQSDSVLARELTKDPYVLDFLSVGHESTERELENALIHRIIETLHELGPGFAFVGRQVHFAVGGDDFWIDLLFFHIEQLRYVVVELKIGKFKPDHVGQLGFYVALVDERLRGEQHAATVGILLCADKNDTVVRYSLAGANSPIAVSRYDLLPPSEQAALPTEDQIARAFDQRSRSATSRSH